MVLPVFTTPTPSHTYKRYENMLVKPVSAIVARLLTHRGLYLHLIAKCEDTN